MRPHSCLACYSRVYTCTKCCTPRFWPALCSTSVSQQVGCCCVNQYGVLRCIPLPVYHQQAGSAQCPFIIKNWTVSLCPLTRFCINLPGGPWLPISTSQLFGFLGDSVVACSRTTSLGARWGNWLLLCCASGVTSGGTGLPFGLSATAAWNRNGCLLANEPCIKFLPLRCQDASCSQVDLPDLWKELLAPNRRMLVSLHRLLAKTHSRMGTGIIACNPSAGKSSFCCTSAVTPVVEMRLAEVAGAAGWVCASALGYFTARSGGLLGGAGNTMALVAR